jgi:hypothetical protein
VSSSMHIENRKFDEIVIFDNFSIVGYFTSLFW